MHAQYNYITIIPTCTMSHAPCMSHACTCTRSYIIYILYNIAQTISTSGWNQHLPPPATSLEWSANLLLSTTHTEPAQDHLWMEMPSHTCIELGREGGATTLHSKSKEGPAATYSPPTGHTLTPLIDSTKNQFSQLEQRRKHFYLQYLIISKILLAVLQPYYNVE